MRWIKSSFSFSNGNCVEVAFERSSLCQTGECVEVAACSHGALVRDSKLGEESPVLSFGAGTWRAFTAAVRAGEFRV